MKSNTLILLWLFFVFLIIFLPWWKTVYFQWDDIELLMLLRFPKTVTLFSPHSYQIFPLFLSLYSLEILLFGVNPAAFFFVSVLLHLINIFLTYKLTLILTKKRNLSFAAAILVSFNKSFYPIIFWPTLQSNLLLTAFTLLSLIFFLKLRKEASMKLLVSTLLGLIAANLSFGFGIPSGFILSLAALLFWPKNQQKIKAIIVCSAVAILGVTTVLTFSTNQLQNNRILDNFWSAKRLVNILYFTLVGPTQAVISRFFIPGFQPNIYQTWNVITMIVIPTLISLFILLSAWKTLGKRKNFSQMAPLFIFGGLLFSSYFMAALARSLPGAHKALAERYVYYPVFNFVLLIVYSFSLIETGVVKLHRLIKPVIIGSLTIIMIGHLIGMNFYVYHFFTSIL